MGQLCQNQNQQVSSGSFALCQKPKSDADWIAERVRDRSFDLNERSESIVRNFDLLTQKKSP